MIDSIAVPVTFGLLAFVYIVAGLITKYKPPTKINPTYGYRTKRSKKNQSSWEFAQRFSAQWMLISGLLMIPIAFASYFMDTQNMTNIVLLIFITLIISLLPLILTEFALKHQESSF